MLLFVINNVYILLYKIKILSNGGLAQLVERVLSMHEVAGSIPASSRYILDFLHSFINPHNLNYFSSKTLFKNTNHISYYLTSLGIVLHYILLYIQYILFYFTYPFLFSSGIDKKEVSYILFYFSYIVPY